MGHSVTVGRPRVGSAASVRQRRAHLRRALTAAAGTPLPLPMYDLTRGPEIERLFNQLAMEAGFAVRDHDSWPVEDGFIVVDDTVMSRSGTTVLHKLPDGTLALVSVEYGWCSVRLAAASESPLTEVFSAFRGRYPAAYLSVTEDLRVPITFWTNSHLGPIPRLRRIESADWDGIEGNYTADVRVELDRLMSWERGPEDDGQLMIWLGPPGTGKSWALRALASRWAPWAEFHCIVDPDAFFVKDASYMASVLLADSYEAIDQPTGDVYSEADPEGKWRVLILEDTGELLAADAKDEYGQGLSRLLNVVDGMLGQGLRILALVTTNDEIDGLHPAAVRPGRCISRGADGIGPTTFGPLTAEEAQVWSGDSDAEAGTLAELYARARYGEAAAAFEVEDDALVASAESLEDIVALARRPLEFEVAEPEEVVAAAPVEDDPHAMRTIEAYSERARASDAIALAAVDALGKLAQRPETAPAHIETHIHLAREDMPLAVRSERDAQGRKVFVPINPDEEGDPS